MRKTLTIVTALALGTTLVACEKAAAPDANATAEANEVVDTVDANAVDANAVDANAVDANVVDAANNVTEQGSTDHGSTDH